MEKKNFLKFFAAYQFSKLKKFDSGMTSMLGTTDDCEQTFLKMNNSYVTKFMDGYLRAISLVRCSNSQTSIDYIMKGKRQFHKSQ